jgi:hypothetical protein
VFVRKGQNALRTKDILVTFLEKEGFSPEESERRRGGGEVSKGGKGHSLVFGFLASRQDENCQRIKSLIDLRHESRCEEELARQSSIDLTDLVDGRSGGG